VSDSSVHGEENKGNGIIILNEY